MASGMPNLSDSLPWLDWFCSNGVLSYARFESYMHACNTVDQNYRAKVEPISHWSTLREAASSISSTYARRHRADHRLLALPVLSIGGKNGNFLDERDMFTSAMRVVRYAVRAPSSSRTCK